MTPIFRIALSLGGVRVPGSHSNVISSASVHGVTAVSRLTSSCSCGVDKNEGVPPPKYTNVSGRPAIAGCSEYISHSRASTSRYRPTSCAFLSVYTRK